MVNACVVLHNIANAWDVPIPEYEPEVHSKSIMNNLDRGQPDDFDEESPTIDATRVMLVDKLWKDRT
ncbi:jg27724 [Pararge aegeria aegeria]|uniref:Jg27724 protein n=1 Tax=Pararge aegeria aegeria TaxID=348720 RepID=A0A8S4R089_9NEOP|nr:jg27724 [Pararge aegeria aegeria]